MKTLRLAALLLMPVLAASARASMGHQDLGQDPLSQQIRRKAIQVDAGITTAVRLGDGRTIKLQAVDGEKALEGLKVAEGLAEKKKSKGRKAKPRKEPKAAVEQAGAIKKDGWLFRRGSGHGGAL